MHRATNLDLRLFYDCNWLSLSSYNQISAAYNFVKDEILFGYNISDKINASRILSDGFGQCNTKSTLLITLLRAMNIPSRIHAFYLDHNVQKGVLSGLSYILAPKLILHTWAEVWFNNEWIPLEGVILDKKYIESFQLQSKEKNIPSKSFQGYAFGVDNLYDIDVTWNGNATYIQSTGIVTLTFYIFYIFYIDYLNSVIT